MYVLNDEYNPFAIVKDGSNYAIKLAISEEYGIDRILSIANFKLPDWGLSERIEFNYINDLGDEVVSHVVITKLATY